MVNKMHIPNGWRSVRLGEVADVVGGSTPSRTEQKFWDGGIPWVVPSELTDLSGRYLTSTKESITEKGMKSAGLKLIPPGSVLLTSRATIGVTAISAMPLVTNQGFQNLLVKNGIDTLWLYYCVSQQRMALQRRASGSTFLEVSRDSVRSIPVLLPPLSEQRAIAAVLDSIDETIERTEEVIATKEQLRASLLHELLTHGVPGWHKEWKEVRSLGTVPACWEVVRLGDVTEVNPRRPPLKVEPMNSVTFVPMAAVAENCGGIVAPELRPFREVARGYTYFQRQDVLFAKITPCLQNGKHALAANLSGEFGFGTTEFHVIRAGPSMDPRHLFRVLTQPSNLERCQKSFSGTAGQQRVHPDVLRELRLCRPPLDEQRAIAGLMDGVDMAIEKERQVRERLQSLKDSTADVLLTGRVQIQKEGATASV